MIKGILGAALAALAGFVLGLALVAAGGPAKAQGYQSSFNCEALHRCCMQQLETQNPTGLYF